ncbi:MAG: twin-arginine translocase TatA/TatE family subunit [Anaerolineaceae bacterium]|nr:twin-arginine translocase TatA/TatE family subunit [Anaerolineaceae bacterium]
MRIFNVGLREVLLLLVIILILYGPHQMAENARKLAQMIRRFVHSNAWRTFLGIYDDVNTIKEEVIRESGLREVQDSLRDVNTRLYNIDREMQKTEWKDAPANGEVLHSAAETVPDRSETHGSDAE